MVLFVVCKYWSSKLATERKMLLDCFTQNDVVCMFVYLYWLITPMHFLVSPLHLSALL